MRILFVSICILLTSHSFTQQTTDVSNLDNYSIIELGNNQNIESIKSAMEIADFQYYRLNNTRRVLSFTDGTSVELKSTTELGLPAITERNPANLIYPNKFSISSNGIIVEHYSNTEKIKK